MGLRLGALDRERRIAGPLSPGLGMALLGKLLLFPLMLLCWGCCCSGTR